MKGFFVKKIIVTVVVMCFMCVCTTRAVDLPRVAEQKNDDIVKLSICADNCRKECKNGLLSFGHAFLMAENISDEVITIYHYELQPKEIMTFSWWAVDKHMGVWFNIESSYVNLTPRYDNLRSLSVYMSENDIKVLTDYISDNDYYTPISNCSKQVIRCWNTIAESGERLNEAYIMTPNKIIEQIERFSEMQAPDVPFNKNICYFEGDEQVLFDMEV